MPGYCEPLTLAFTLSKIGSHCRVLGEEWLSFERTALASLLTVDWLRGKNRGRETCWEKPKPKTVVVAWTRLLVAVGVIESSQILNVFWRQKWQDFLTIRYGVWEREKKRAREKEKIIQDDFKVLAWATRRMKLPLTALERAVGRAHQEWKIKSSVVWCCMALVRSKMKQIVKVRIIGARCLTVREGS